MKRRGFLASCVAFILAPWGVCNDKTFDEFKPHTYWRTLPEFDEWPEGTGDESYDFWSPLLLNCSSTSWSNDKGQNSE